MGKMAKPRHPGAQWFDEFPGPCACGHTARGWLMSTRNDRLRAMCRPCADKEIKAANRWREQEAKS
jgi:hypothetical protein